MLVNTPVAPLIVATEVLLLLKVPPVVPLASVTDVPVHSEVGPVVAAGVDGAESTVSERVATAEPQLLLTVYDTVTTPVATPVSVPVAEMVAVAVLLLRQVPPLTALAKVMAAPRQTLVAPVMVPADAAGLTVTTLVA